MVKKAISIILIITMLFTLVSCSSTAAVYVQVVSDDVRAVNTSVTDESLYIAYKAREDLIRVSRTDMSVLYFDEQTYSISVYDANSGVLWNCLASEYIGQASSMFTVDLLIGGHEYTLNSQDDSLSMGNASYEIIDNTIKIDYTFQTQIADVDVDFTVPLEFVAEDGKLTVKLDCSSLYENQDISEVAIVNINLLEYFGSNTNQNEGDYIVIPDGSGAIIDTGEVSKEFEPVSVSVYSGDYSIDQDMSEATAIIASFGMKTLDAAFVALVEQGEEIATINATKAQESNSYNSVSASFEITSTQVSEDDSKVYYSTTPYDGAIQLSYRFLSDDNANYVAMASATRELLIRNGSLTTSTVSSDTSLPMNITLIGSAVVVDENDDTQIQTLTTFEQASQIISFLKSKDFNTLNIQYTGILQGSTAQYDINDVDLMPKLGSDDEFQDLLSEVSAQQGYSMYVDFSLISASTSKSFSQKAVNIFSEFSTISVTSFDYQSDNLSELYLASPQIISQNTNELLAFVRENEITSVSLNDVGSVLYSDNNKEETYSITQTKQIISEQVQAISSSSNLMVDTGNLYTIKYADVIMNLPQTSSIDELEYCSSIPYMQIILHGSVFYSSSASNIQEDIVYAMLKDIEYGSIPSVVWYYENLEDDYYYMNNISTIQSYYSLANSTLSDLTSARITAHYEVLSGVYCTEYDNTSLVYVNYNDETVSVAGVDIQPLSFVRVN